MLALLLALPAHAGEWREPRRTLPADPQPCLVIRVIDGDSLVCDGGVRVRIRGVDSPERGEVGWGEAKRELERRVDGREVILVPHHMNRGRVVADIILAGENIGVAMDREGWSKPNGARR